MASADVTLRLARDLDLNLLRVYVVVAEGGSVTQAALRLYLTQPAVSEALRRLATAVGAPLFAKHGRGLVLTARGEKLLAEVKAPLLALTRAVEATPELDLRTDETVFRLELGHALEGLLVPPLLRSLARDAPRMRVIVLPVQFRTIGEAFAARRVGLAVTVADELPLARQGGAHLEIDRRLFRLGYFRRAAGFVDRHPQDEASPLGRPLDRHELRAVRGCARLDARTHGGEVGQRGRRFRGLFGEARARDKKKAGPELGSARNSHQMGVDF